MSIRQQQQAPPLPPHPIQQGEDGGQCSRTTTPTHATPQVFSTAKGPMRVCLKRPGESQCEYRYYISNI